MEVAIQSDDAHNEYFFTLRIIILSYVTFHLLRYIPCQGS